MEETAKEQWRERFASKYALWVDTEVMR